LLAAWVVILFCHKPEGFAPFLGGKIGGDFADLWAAAKLTLAR